MRVITEGKNEHYYDVRGGGGPGGGEFGSLSCARSCARLGVWGLDANCWN